MRAESIVAAAGNVDRLQLGFAWLGDRYGQRILIVADDGSSHPLLESIEGSAAEDWPASPPLQSLTIQTLPDGRTAALLVGAAGKSHWSASIEADRSSPTIVFDLACRHGEQPGSLGSRYRWMTDAAKLIVISPDQVTEDGDALVIQPGTPPSSAGTTRWRFRLELAPGQTAR
jgi:hypothetical protein